MRIRITNEILTGGSSTTNRWSTCLRRKRAWSSSLTSDLEHLFSNSQSRDGYVCQVSLKSVQRAGANHPRTPRPGEAHGVIGHHNGMKGPQWWWKALYVGVKEGLGKGRGPQRWTCGRVQTNKGRQKIADHIQACAGTVHPMASSKYGNTASREIDVKGRMDNGRTDMMLLPPVVGGGIINR